MGTLFKSLSIPFQIYFVMSIIPFPGMFPIAIIYEVFEKYGIIIGLISIILHIPIYLFALWGLCYPINKLNHKDLISFNT